MSVETNAEEGRAGGERERKRPKGNEAVFLEHGLEVRRINMNEGESILNDNRRVN